MKKIVLIDFSNLMHRLVWWDKMNIGTGVQMHITELFDIMIKKIRNEVIKMNSHKFMFDHNNLFFLCLDDEHDENGQYWRHRLLQEYKGKRKKDESEYPFKENKNKIIEHILTNCASNSLHVSVPGVEADDLAYILIKMLPIPIQAAVSNDNDWQQLLLNTELKQMIVQKKINGKKQYVSLTNCDYSEETLKEKINKGDTSDNIMSVRKSGNYELNKKLIDMREIPKEIFDKVVNEWKRLIELHIKNTSATPIDVMNNEVVEDEFLKLFS